MIDKITGPKKESEFQKKANIRKTKRNESARIQKKHTWNVCEFTLEK